MSGPVNDPSKELKGFLEKLGEPLEPNRAKQTTGRVLDSLRAQHREPASGVIHFPAPVAAGEAGKGRSWFAAAAAAVVLVASAFLLQFISFHADSGAVAETVEGELQIVRAGISTAVHSGTIQSGWTLRTADGGGAVIRLRDGSRIELSGSVQLSIHPVADGTELRLVDGSVIVSAAKQVRRHLYVTTNDCSVSVLGTVFSVSAGTSGSRVSVIQGEVRVNVREETRVLFPGEQMATNPSVELVPVPAELQWSRNLVAHLALLELVRSSARPASPLQDSRGIIRGTVKRAGSEEGSPDVAVTLCEGRVISRAAQLSFSLPPRETVGQIRIVSNGLGAAAPSSSTVEIRDRLGNLLSSSFTAVVCKNPIAATTDRSGRFEIRDVAPGEYTLRAQREGYFGPQRAGRWQTSADVLLAVSTDQAVPEVALFLVPGGTISGRVRGPNGQPLAEATVQALELVGFGAEASLRVISGRQTDDRGEYRLYNLPPGELYIAATPPGTNRAETGQQPQKTYYPSALDPGAATAVSVGIGQEAPRTDIDVRMANLARISATIGSTTGGMGSTNVTVTARGIQADNTRSFRFGSAQGQAALMISGLTAGTYDFIATGTCQSSTPSTTVLDLPDNERDLLNYLQTLAASRGVTDPSRSCVGITSVDVRDRDVEGIMVTLRPRVDVAGRVSFSGVSLRPGDIQARLDPDGLATRIPMLRVSVNANADGLFVIGGVPPGRFRPDIRLSGPLQDSYVADVRQSGVSVLENGFDVDTSAPAPLEVVISAGGGAVSGIVRDAAQKPVSNAFVVLVPSGSRNLNRSLYPSAAADATGRFTIRGIAPGEYKLFAWYQDPGQLPFNATALSRFETFSRTLNIASGSNTPSLQITVVPDLFSK